MRTHYAVQTLIDLVLHNGEDNLVPLKDIAKRQGISQTYLEHIITALIANGLLRTVRGPKGGIKLAKNAKEINLKTVVEIMQGSVDPVECLVDARTCPRSNLCAARDTWTELKTAIETVLTAATLKDLAERQTTKVKTEDMYYI
jgi:Rrf2 family protein